MVTDGGERDSYVFEGLYPESGCNRLDQKLNLDHQIRCGAPNHHTTSIENYVFAKLRTAKLLLRLTFK